MNNNSLIIPKNLHIRIYYIHPMSDLLRQALLPVLIEVSQQNFPGVVFESKEHLQNGK